MKTKFRTANEAYAYLHNMITLEGVPFDNTKALFNVGFNITEPWNRNIINRERKWNKGYAEAEWQWYLSGSPNLSVLGDIYGKVPAIWQRMGDLFGKVRSNYGWQWRREDQLEAVIAKLIDNPNTRQACISIYDGKEIDSYAFDTPCTYAVQFTILDSKLDMCVTMRSNDLWYGFCNDQYQFSKLQEMVSNRLGLEMGTYYHFAHNLHLYNDKI